METQRVSATCYPLSTTVRSQVHQGQQRSSWDTLDTRTPWKKGCCFLECKQSSGYSEKKFGSSLWNVPLEPRSVSDHLFLITSTPLTHRWCPPPSPVSCLRWSSSSESHCLFLILGSGVQQVLVPLTRPAVAQDAFAAFGCLYEPTLRSLPWVSERLTPAVCVSVHQCGTLNQPHIFISYQKHWVNAGGVGDTLLVSSQVTCVCECVSLKYSHELVPPAIIIPPWQRYCWAGVHR